MTAGGLVDRWKVRAFSAGALSDEKLRPTRNNLTLVRMMLASAVIWTHCVFMITASDDDGVRGLLGIPISAAAVDGFFFISGFLVYRSLCRRDRLVDFARARLLRLWPGLAVMIVVTTAAGLELGARVGPETTRYVVMNLLLVGASHTLNWTHGHPDIVINGSLWSIPYEVKCYALLALLSFTGLARPRVMAFAVIPATLAIALLYEPSPPHAEVDWRKFCDLGVRVWTMFALGIAAYLGRRALVLEWWAAGLLTLIAVLAHRFGLHLLIRELAVGYLVLCLAFRTPLLSGRWPDFSYGTYIYAFPVMVGFHAGGWFPAPGPLAAATFAATLPLAALSWYLIEAPALRLVRRAGPVAAAQPPAGACASERAGSVAAR